MKSTHASLSLLASALTLLLSITPSVVAQSDYCLSGFVWREAIPADHVCVTPQIRSATQADNNAAASRREPNGGAYGPDTCKSGFVWREAFSGDHVCVTPATRSQVQSDNSQAANRVASLNTWTTNWYPGPVCNGDICTTTSDSDIPRFKVNGDHFNLGQVRAGIYKINGDVKIWEQTVNTAAYSGYGNYAFGVQSPVINCRNSPNDAYIRVYDLVSARWGPKIFVPTGCKVL